MTLVPYDLQLSLVATPHGWLLTFGAFALRRLGLALKG